MVSKSRVSHGEPQNTTQSLADRVRAFTHPDHPRPEGIKAPSVHTPAAGGHQPSQYSLFVMDGRRLSGQIAWRADPTLEFPDLAGNQAGRDARGVAWTRPRFQLHGLAAPIPAFTPRPGSQPYRSGRCYPIEIRSL